MVNAGRPVKGEPVTAPEVLIINGPSYAAPPDEPLFSSGRNER